MRLLAIGFLVGVVTLVNQAELPDPLYAWALLPLVLLFFLLPGSRLLWGLLAGFCWALLQSYQQLYPVLPLDLEGEDIVIEAQVLNVPQRNAQRLRFIVKPLQAKSENGSAILPEKLRLAWYRAPVTLKSGERWRLQVRLKRAHGFKNPGGFDYERWLFTQGIGATGYVRDSEENQRIAAAGFSINALREQISSRIKQHFKDENSGLLQALTLGLRADIDPRDWDTLIATGTNHLLAISGLHIGLVAGFGYWLVLWLWRLSPQLCCWFPAQRAAALLSLFPALSYAALAGFSVPTQRALIMLAVIAAGVAWSRPVAKTTLLAIALFAVLVFDSLAVLSPGFWLSFTAVTVIFLGLWGNMRPAGKWRQLLWVQLWLSLALLPLTFWFFGQGSLASPLANLFAVPLVGIFIVPLALMGVVMLYLYAPLGAGLLSVANTGLDRLLAALGWLAAREGALVHQSIPSVWILILLLLSAAILLAPRGLPGRWLALIWMLPLFLIKTPAPEYGGFRVSFLDVGQGLSVVVQTQGHTLLYDTGARFSPRFSAVEAAVMPFLRQQGINRIDTLVLSHADSDHSGGAGLLRESIAVEKTLASFAASMSQQLCRAGQHWEWEGVYFHILHPPTLLPEVENDRSCVLSIENDHGRVLLTGDISRRVEGELISEFGQSLASTVIQVPHHGSLTSSSETFIDNVKPGYAVFNVGYRNRFGFPKPAVEDRYRKVGATVLRTDKEGAVIFEFAADQAEPSLRTGRSKPHIWQLLPDIGFGE